MDPQNSLKQYVAEETSPAAAGEEKTKVGEGEGEGGRAAPVAPVYRMAQDGRVRDLLSHVLVHVRAHLQRVLRVHRGDMSTV